ncbi:hypothetical protein MLD38_030028 [Melastoma candidum]|uniref:Uncharacterized protein n=1 Tax=Melastoma candidum TaxID=119954 RepID=A0ACB9MKK3_9MYRT|nr:hypothetical protein MLD38_030028 [Melastoma candidum]
MNDADVSKQVQQMIMFIRQEAEEKANEISVSAEEDFNIENMQIVNPERKKIRQEFDQQAKQAVVCQHMIFKMSTQFYVSVLLSCCVAVAAVSATGITDPSEVKALADIKRKLIDPMNYLGNWTKGDPCTSNWTGVLCFGIVSSDGYLHVQELELLNMNLSGTLSPALGQLSQLTILDFMWNEITGSIPSEIGNIASLELLLLNGNKLTGSLPEELGYLPNLDRIQVDENSLSGSIPKSFANLPNIRHLHLNNNTIGGQIPPELSNLSTLVHLLVDNNNLSGYLPPSFSTMNLQILQLDNNNFGGNEIPPSYGSFSKLMKLSLRNCSLSGPMPDFSPIPFLSYIDLSMNNLTGPIPANRLSENITTIILSDNQLNGSIPASFSDFRFLQRLSLANNLLTGSVSTNIWQNVTLISPSKLTINLENNSISNITGQLDPPANVSISLAGNPVCNNVNTQNISQFCGQQSGGVDTKFTSSNSTSCPFPSSCPTDNYYEYVPESPNPCFCASPLRVGYRLKSPSFSYFPPYELLFEEYLTGSLDLELHQLYIDSYDWEEGPRLKMYLKLYPAYTSNRTTFNESEVLRIRDAYTAWRVPDNDFFGPYELLNFTLLGPYSTIVLPSPKSGMSKGVLAAIVLASVAIVAAVSLVVFLLVERRRRRANPRSSIARKQLLSRISMKIEGVKEFTFRELAMATDNFNISTEVGEGGYGKVYRGCLLDKTVVAIKRAEEGSLQGQQEFLTEIKLLSRLHHRNLVSLIGYCDEEGEQMLVYEFMPNGSLRDWLSGKAKESLNFNMRMQAALGSAKGILYLHTEANPPVFHRDIKASNILLDSHLIAKVADFGLSRLAPVLDNEGVIPSHVSTVVKGTPGYLDPEYFLTHKLTDKSDVYSLGVVFLELLTGMHPISHGKNIVREVNMANESGMMFSIIDNKMGSYPAECIEKFVALSLRCCHPKPEDRPSASEVVRELENIIKMMPESDNILTETSSVYTRKTFPPSSSYMSRNTDISLGISGSDLVSGVVPTINPR